MELKVFLLLTGACIIKLYKLVSKTVIRNLDSGGSLVATMVG